MRFPVIIGALPTAVRTVVQQPVAPKVPANVVPTTPTTPIRCGYGAEPCDPYFEPRDTRDSEGRRCCGRKPNVQSVTVWDRASGVQPDGSVLVTSCSPPMAAGGLTADGRLVCVQCAPGYHPDPNTFSCVNTPLEANGQTFTEDLIPWMKLPMDRSMKQLALPAIFYSHKLLLLDPVRDRRRSTFTNKLDDNYAKIREHLCISDFNEFMKHKDDSKIALNKLDKLKASQGELPWMTWEDPVTKIKVGAFTYYFAMDPTITIKPWDPYTASDLWDDIKDVFCATMSNPATMVAAPATAAACGLPPAAGTAIVTAGQALCGGSTMSQETATTEQLGQLPPGTIHCVDGNMYRIAIPVTSAAVVPVNWRAMTSIAKERMSSVIATKNNFVLHGLGATPDGKTHVEIAPSATDPTAQGSTLTDKEKFLQSTGQYRWYKDWRYMVPIGALAIGGAVGGGIYIRRRRNKRSV